MSREEIDPSFIICPYCGNKYLAEAEQFSEEIVDETCEACGQEYQRYDNVTIEHITIAVKENP